MEAQPTQNGHPQPCGQPVVAERTAALLRLLGAGLLASILSLLCFLMTSRTLLRVGDQSRLWPTAVNICATVAVLVSLLQWWVWHQAQREWLGVKDVALAGWIAPSRTSAWVAAVAGILGCIAAVQLVRTTAPAEHAHWWALTGGMLLVLGVAFGCLHPIKGAGPRGVLPRVISRNLDPRRATRLNDADADTLVLRRGPTS